MVIIILLYQQSYFGLYVVIEHPFRVGKDIWGTFEITGFMPSVFVNDLAVAVSSNLR
jgi:hypothetical protein